MVAIGIPVILFSEHRQSNIEELVNGEWFAGHPFWSATAIIALFSLDILLPVPSTAVCATAGKLFGVWLGIVLCWIGLNLSALIGYTSAYVLGWPVACRLSSESDLNQVRLQVEKWGVWPLVLLRPIPVLAEASILLAGVYRMPWRKFWPPILIANLVFAWTFVKLGNWFAQRGQFWPGLVISCLIPVLLMVLWSVAFRKKAWGSERRPGV